MKMTLKRAYVLVAVLGSSTACSENDPANDPSTGGTGGAGAAGGAVTGGTGGSGGGVVTGGTGGGAGAVTGGAGGGPVQCVHTTTDSVMKKDSDTLPAGACVPDPNEPVCKLIVRAPCPCTNIQSPRSFYDCTCVEGNWSCVLTSQDTGICPGPVACVGEDGGLVCFGNDGGVVACPADAGAG
jgi:hypothetical protein